MVPHPGKSETMKIGSLPVLRSSENIDICLSNCKLNEVDVVKYLGVYIDSALTWSNQLSSVCVKVYPKLRLLNFLLRDVLLKVYKQTILPILDYQQLDCPKAMSAKLESLQNQALCTILKADRKMCSQRMREKCGLLSLKNRRFLRFQLVFKIVHNFNCTEHLISYLPTRHSLHSRSLRDEYLLNLPRAKSAMGQKSFKFSAANDWNLLPKWPRLIDNFNTFKLT